MSLNVTDMWAGGSLTVKETFKDTFDQFKISWNFGEFWVGLLYIFACTGWEGLRTVVWCHFNETGHLQKVSNKTVVSLRTALIPMRRPSLPGITSHLLSKQGGPLTRCTQRHSAGEKTHRAPSRRLPAKQPVSTRRPTRGRPPSRAGAEVRRITFTPMLTFSQSLRHHRKTSATPLLASAGSRPWALSPPSPTPTPLSPTCHQMSRRSTATSEQPLLS